MAVSNERITELFDQMLANADTEGWCYMPDGLTAEEQDELSKRIAIMTMQDRIDSITEGIAGVFSFMNNIKDKVNDLETMDIISVKYNLDNIKEDAQTILIDLHSDDVIADFFRIDIISPTTGEIIEDVDSDADEAKLELGKLVDTEFKDQLLVIKEQCSAMIEMVDELKRTIK
jgi:hypothetical protein